MNVTIADRLLEGSLSADELSPDVAATVLLDLNTRASRISSVQNELCRRIYEAETVSTLGRLITVKETEERYGIPSHFIYKNAKQLPFVRRIGRRTVRIVEPLVRRYVETAR